MSKNRQQEVLYQRSEKHDSKGVRLLELESFHGFSCPLYMELPGSDLALSYHS